MRYSLRILIASMMFFGCVNVYAAEPIINYNVTVIQNTDAAHCPATYDGDSGDDTLTDMSGYGLDSGITSAGIQSCTGCALDPKTKDCVCKTCYGYYN